MATWKAVEKRIAKRLGGHRVGCTGGASPDVIASGGYLLVEVKHRKALPAWLTSALAQVRQHCESDQLGIVVLHEKGKRGDNDMVVMAMADFESLWGIGP